MSFAGTKRARRDLDAGSAPAAVCGASARTAAADDDSMARTRAMLARRLGPSPPRVACVSIEGRGRAGRARAREEGRDLPRRASARGDAGGGEPRALPRVRALSLARGRFRRAPPRARLGSRLAPRAHRRRAQPATRPFARSPPGPPLSLGDATDAVARGPVPCARGCGDVFCSPGCRDAAARWHALLCTGGCDEGNPIYEFRRHAMRSHESFLLAANALARALAEAGASDGVGDGEAGDANDADEDDEDDENRTTLASNAASTAAATLATLPTPAAPWWETAARANAPPSHPDAPPDVARGRRVERLGALARAPRTDGRRVATPRHGLAHRPRNAPRASPGRASQFRRVRARRRGGGRRRAAAREGTPGVRVRETRCTGGGGDVASRVRRAGRIAAEEADVEADEEADDEEETRSSRDASEDDSDTDDDSDSDTFDSEGSTTTTTTPPPPRRIRKDQSPRG